MFLILFGLFFLWHIFFDMLAVIATVALVEDVDDEDEEDDEPLDDDDDDESLGSSSSPGLSCSFFDRFCRLYSCHLLETPRSPQDLDYVLCPPPGSSAVADLSTLGMRSPTSDPPNRECRKRCTRHRYCNLFRCLPFGSYCSSLMFSLFVFFF